MGLQRGVQRNNDSTAEPTEFEIPAYPTAPSTEVKLLVGPANFAGQAGHWAGAVEANVPGVGAQSYAFVRGRLDYPVDYGVPVTVYSDDSEWGGDFERFVTRSYTHVLLEANRPFFGRLYGDDASHDVPKLLEAGLEVALIAHGSDVRIPSLHVEMEEWSPFPDLEDRTVNNLEKTSRRSVDLFTSYPGHVYVSTPDLLDFVPNATWCPVVVDPPLWRSDAPVMERERPIVAHAPSKSKIKGSDLIDPILRRLAHEDLIEYRRVEHVDPADMPAVYKDADIVVDQVRVGSYGVAACEAMAAGRVVLGHVADHVRRRIVDETSVELPIVEVTPDTLEEVVRGLIADRPRARKLGAEGVSYVDTVHDGRHSARVLEPFLRSRDSVARDWKPEWVGPKVVMLAGNDIVIDARVLKYAQTVAQWGFEVSAVGIAGRYMRGTRELGRVTVVAPGVLPKASNSGWRGRLAHLRPWFSHPDEYNQAIGRWTYDSRELSGDRGRDERNALRVATPAEGALPAPRRRGGVGKRLSRAFRWRTLKLRKSILDLRAIPAHRAPRAVTSGDLGIGPRRDRRIRTWRRLPWGKWRRVMPQTLDQEMTLGPIIDRLRPDLIHVHDVFMLGIGARAAQRAALAGRLVRVVYDAHEYIPGVAVVPPRTIAAYCDLEAEFIGDADRVITVSEPLAGWLQRDHKLARRPDVVLNAPVEVPEDAMVQGVREVVGLDPDVPLLVYVGGVNRARGVGTAVEALPALPGVHLAVVCRANGVTAELQDRAETLGVDDRVHFLPFVDPELVPAYVKSATIGLSPLLHAPNHDIAVTNKFCEYIAAGVPIVTSDTPAQADLVRELDLGAVHVAGDVDDFTRAVREVLADRDRLAKRIETDPDLRHRFSWAAQAEVIRDVYADLLGELPKRAWEDGATKVTKLIKEPASSTALVNRLRAMRGAARRSHDAADAADEEKTGR